MSFHNFHSTKVYDQNTGKWVSGYLQNIAMTPIKFRFSAKQRDQLSAGEKVNTDVMKYRVLTVKPYGARNCEAVLINDNLI